MLLESNAPESADYVVYDANDQPIPYVVSFDTETLVIELLVKIGDDSRMLMFTDDNGVVRPVALKFKLYGAYAKNVKQNIPT